MKKIIILTFLITVFPFSGLAQITIEECVTKAQANYPLIKKYELLSLTKEIELSDINKSWLPKIEIYGQLTGQNVVPSFPETLTGVLEQMGQKMSGLDKIQYKVGADISQTIWDGGASALRRRITEERLNMDNARLDVELYSIRERVENLYFAILLTEEQIAQTETTYNLLQANLKRLKAMFRNGIAMQSDLDMVEAQALSLNQNIIMARQAGKAYREMLSIFMGEALEETKLIRPSADEPVADENQRPELKLFDTRLNLNRTTDRMADIALRPKIGFFAQAYYGYPGFDYFKSMMKRELSFNILAGIKISWNIDGFYTKKNSSRRTMLNATEIEVERDVFLFNNRIQASSEQENIKALRMQIKDDSRIIRLRANVREAAESQLKNGIIDATALLTKISDENIARLSALLHEIELIKEIYKLKYTLNQ